MLVDPSVKYIVGNNNRFLRFALFEAWENGCYWCKKPVDFTIIEIDHIIPKSVDDDKLQQIVHNYSLNPNYDLNAVYNLAPICRPCNGKGEKGELLLAEAPVILTRLRKAEKLSQAIAAKVLKMRISSAQAGNILEVAEMKLDTEESRKLFEDHAPAIVQKLANLGAGALQYTTSTGVVVDPRTGRPFVDVFLDERGRMTGGVIEEVVGQSLESAVQAVARSVVDVIRAKIHEAFGELPKNPSENDNRDVWVDIWDNFQEYIILTSLNFEREDKFVEFVFAGSYSSEFLAEVTRQHEDGDGLDSGRGSVTIDSQWRVSMGWSGEWGELLEVMEASLVLPEIEKSLTWR